jgi:hypothetical protein
MKIYQKITGLMLIMFLALTSFACGGSTTSITTEAPEETSIVGEYLIDITDLGMPLQFYLKIDADNKFYLAPDREYLNDKGHGTIGSSGNTYMLIYSDSTSEEPKTSTFTMSEKNIHFQTNLPYGSSNLPASKVDEDNPDITYYLVGKTLMYEDYFGEYAGGHTVSAMGSDVEYNYYLKLEAGREFKFVSNYSMSGTDYEYLESGYYDFSNSELTLHLSEEDVVGNFDQDMNLAIPVKASEMGERVQRTLRVATTASCASTYFALLDLSPEPVNATLTLDKFGGYVYVASDGVDEVTETGSFTIAGQNLTFHPADSEETFTGTLVNFVLNAPFKVTTSAESRTLVRFYCQTVQGVFTATGEDEAENVYHAELELFADGTFTFVITDEDENIIIDETGTFTITKFMLTQLNLLSDSETPYSLVVSQVGLNVNVLVAEETTVGFILIKE